MKQQKEKLDKSNRLRTHLFVFLCFISISVPVTYIVFNQYNFDNNCGQNFVSVGSSAIGGDFTLTNTQNQKQNSESIIFKPSLIYFGYSFCPDICPFDLQRNVTAVDILKEQNISILPIFITIDPDRDTVQRLKEFEAFVHPDLVALTGSKSEILSVMKKFRVYGNKSSLNTEDNYLMDHSAFTYLVNSDNKFIDFFKRQTSPEEMADKISCLLN